tara:strand:+ start:217 stop:510 length:294 start_codon:yes stop_codon:yes gene_type:complete
MLLHNITGELTTKISSIDNPRTLSKISLANVHGSLKCSVDLFLEKEGDGPYYLFKQVSLPADTSLIHDLAFNAKEWNLFVKLTKSASETPAVDVILY